MNRSTWRASDTKGSSDGYWAVFRSRPAVAIVDDVSAFESLQLPKHQDTHTHTHTGAMCLIQVNAESIDTLNTKIDSVRKVYGAGSM